MDGNEETAEASPVQVKHSIYSHESNRIMLLAKEKPPESFHETMVG